LISWISFTLLTNFSFDPTLDPSLVYKHHGRHQHGHQYWGQT
jgi:hypothetical protein